MKVLPIFYFLCIITLFPSNNPSYSTMSIFGIVLLFFVNDWISFFITLECQSLLFYLLVSSSSTAGYNGERNGENKVENNGENKGDQNSAIGIQYFLVGSLSSVIILLGISMIYIQTGITSFSIPIETGYEYLIILGLLMKIGLPPFHQWNIDIIANSRSDLSLFFSTISKISLLYLLKFIFIHYSLSISSLFLPILLSWIIGTFIGLIQNKTKRILAYSGLIHLGWILLSILSTATFSIYFIQYFIALTIIFFLYLNTQVNKKPIEAFLIIINLLSLAGYPPFLGFLGKYLVLNTFINQSSYGLMGISGMLFSVFSFFIYFNWISSISVKSNNLESNSIESNSIELIGCNWIISFITFIPLTILISYYIF